MIQELLKEFSDGFGCISTRLLYVQDRIGPTCGRWLVAKSYFKRPRLLVAVLLIDMSVSHAAIYYVATNGNDGNPGSISRPFATFNAGLSVMSPGDTLYVRGGSYAQFMNLWRSGTASSPITVAGYPGETAVIDGHYTIPDNLIYLQGAYVIVKDMTLQQSRGSGINVVGNSNLVVNVLAQSNIFSGIQVGGSSYNVVSNCQVYFNCMGNYQFTNTTWAAGLTVNHGAGSNLIINNKVWNTWGEGMSTYECSNTTMIGNTVWDNKLNVYLSDCKYALLSGNLIYATPGNILSNGTSQVGIEIGDELHRPTSSDNKVINNLVLGCYRNLDFGDGSSNSLVNCVIANNTFANALGAENVHTWGGYCSNSLFADNLILQESGTISGSYLGALPGITFSHNLWSTNPESSFNGAGDVVANPLLNKIGLTGPGQLSADWFGLANDSPAIGAAVALGVVSTDFYGKPRSQAPSIGAIECKHQLAPAIDLHVISP